MPPLRPLSFVLAFAAVVLPRFFAEPAARPDEGQWLPAQVREMDWDALKARGLTLTKDEFWHPTEGGVLTAAVQISGCSASFCSPDGLVVTNHHCGFAAVQQLSTPENNRLNDGYAAATLEDELPAKGMTVFVVRKIENVTERVHRAMAAARTDAERAELAEAETRALVVEGQKEPNTVCSVASFLNGTEFHLYYRTRLDDVRLVYAPQRAIGEFGGETDNWEWPRHTGDFMFFRAYVGPDGTPRPYAKDNVPYRPKHFLKVAKDGVKEGDLVMVLGYPGRTQRYLTAAGVVGQEERFYPIRRRVVAKTIQLLEAASKAGPAKALELSTPIKSLANVEKNAEGMIAGLARNGVVARKRAEEAAFAAWVKEKPERRKKYGGVLRDMTKFEQAQAAFLRRDVLLAGFFGGQAPLTALLSVASDAAGAQGAAAPAATDARAEARKRLGATELTKDFEVVELPLVAFLIDAARRLPAGERLAGLDPFLGAKGEAEIRDLLKTSRMADAAARTALWDGGADAFATSADPWVVLARGLAAERKAQGERRKAAAGRMLELGRTWIAAQQEWRGKAFYPDANSTLRASIATVKGYGPKDGTWSVPRTTVGGLLAKHTGKEPFDAPAALREAAKDRVKSRFVDPATGDVPVCFLSDADTTGGNSGSCVINGRGELVGLNFDRVFENVAGDFGWSPERSRNVVCDVRFVAWCAEAVLPCPRLLKELGF